MKSSLRHLKTSDLEMSFWMTQNAASIISNYRIFQLITIPRYFSMNLIEISQFNERNAKIIQESIMYLISSHFLIQEP